LLCNKIVFRNRTRDPDDLCYGGKQAVSGRQMAAAAARPSGQPRQAGSEVLAAEREQLRIAPRA